MKIVFTELPVNSEESHAEEIRMLPEEAESRIVFYYPNEPDTSEANQLFFNSISDADIIINSYVEYDRAMLDRLERCRVISFQATGYNAVDLDYATSKQIAVVSIRDYCTQETAENAIAAMMALQRNVVNYNRDVQEKRIWDFSAYPGMRRIEGQTISIIGFGRIGQHVARIAGNGLGMRVLAYDPFVPQSVAESKGVELVDLDVALAEADVVSVHMNLTNDNRYFFTREMFSKMKKSPFFINEGRGEMVEESALKWALDTGTIRGAGIDMLESEDPDLRNCCLLNEGPRNNLIIMPHSGFWSETSDRLVRKYSIENALNYYYRRYDEVHDIRNDVRN